MIRLAAFADEASAAFTGQLAALARNGISLIELRGLDGVNIAEISEAQAKAYAASLREAGVAVWSIGSPIGKISIDGDLAALFDKLRHLCRLAQIFGTDKMRIFGFFDACDKPHAVMEALRKMVAVAAEYGVGLYHENEKKIYGDTLLRVRELMDAVPGLHFVYDPANFMEVGESAEKTLPVLHAKCDYFHIKDVLMATGELVPAGFGDGQIAELIARIGDADRVLTLEPHLAIFQGYAEIDGTEMKNKFTYKTNDEAFDAAVTALKALLTAQGYVEENGGFHKK